MSMDLYLWKRPVVDDPDRAKELVDLYYDERDESVFEPSDDIAALADELRARYTDDAEAQPSDDCPWASLPFEETDRVLALNIRWSADDAVLDYIVELARKHDVVIYDPQGPAVYLPTDPIERDDGPSEPLGWGAYAMAIAVTLLGAFLIVAGWMLSIPILNWLLIAVGLFVLGVGITLIYAFFVFPFQQAREAAARAGSQGGA